MDWIVDEIKAELIAQRHKATGKGLNSIRLEEVEAGKEWIIVGANYLYWVNYGRAPGKMPPLAAIRAWVVAIGLPRKAAYPIARVIAMKGVPAKPYVMWKEGNALKRTNFVGEVIEKNKERIVAELTKRVEINIFEKYRNEKIILQC